MMRLALAAAVALLAVACTDSGASGQTATQVQAPADSTQEIAEADLPDSVTAAVHSHHRAVLRRALKITTGNTVVYDLTLAGTRKTHMVVGADGRVISFE